jgi:hypothetical protein
MKYVNGYYYFSSDSYFYRTDSNFNLNASYAPGAFFGFRQFFFDSNSQLFYIAPFATNTILLFDMNCNYKRSISLQNYYPYGLNIFNNNIYVGTTNNKILVVSKSTEKITNEVNCTCSNDWLFSITIDLFGFMAISTASGVLCLFDSSSVSYTSFFFANRYDPYVTAVVPNGAFVVMATNSLNIYF